MMRQVLKGVYPIIPTPFDKNGNVALTDIEKMIDYAVECGVAGVVVNDYLSEIEFLCDDERYAIAETALKHAAGRIPVIVGIAGQAPNRMVEYAKHAAEHGASAVLASVPFLKAYQASKTYEKGFKAVDEMLDIPIILQDAPDRSASMGAGMQKDLLTKLKNAAYVKEDSTAIHQGIEDTVEMAKGLEEGVLKGVFAGEGGYDLVCEYQLGATNFMPGLHVAPYVQKIWEKLEAGDVEGAEKVQFALSRLRLHERLYQVDTCKYMLKANGVIENIGTRWESRARFDETSYVEMDRILESLAKMGVYINPLFEI